MTNFDEIIYNWLGQFPKGQIPMVSEKRIESLIDLFKRFKANGYDRNFFGDAERAKIVMLCLNPNHPDKKKLRQWSEYISMHLNIAFYKVYPVKINY